MGNRDDVDLFLKGVDAWNESVDTWGVKSEDRVTWGPASDLSGEPVGYRVFNLAWQKGTFLEPVSDLRNRLS